MNSTSNSNLLSKCGIYCGACYIYRAFKDGGEFLDATANEQGVSKEEIKCEGCSGPKENLWRNCKKCNTRSCLQEKGYTSCNECPGFEGSCAKYENLRKFCSNRGEDTKGALNRFKIGEAEEWLKEQDKKWRCTSCRGPISWGEEKCHHCGHTLNSSKQ